MLFHITYEFSPQERDNAQKRFKETGAPPPKGVTMQGRWHSAAGHVGFLVAESSDAVAIGNGCRAGPICSRLRSHPCSQTKRSPKSSGSHIHFARDSNQKGQEPNKRFEATRMI